MKKLSSEVQDAKFTFHKFVGIGAGELGMTPCEACGALERDPVHADKFRVSEAAPELKPCPLCDVDRPQLSTNERRNYVIFCRACGIELEENDREGDAALITRWNARVHQPSEQNSDSGEMQTKASSLSPVVVSGDSSESADLAAEAAYLLSIYAQSDCPNWKEGVGDCGSCQQCRVTRCIDCLEAVNPITQDAGGLPSTTALDPGQASQPKSASTLVTVDEAQKEERI